LNKNLIHPIGMKQISKDILSLASTSKADWCILRKEDEILKGIHNDIDLFVAAEDYLSFIKHIKKGFLKNEIAIIRERYMPAGISYLLFAKNSDAEFEKLDILYDNTLTFISIFPIEQIKAGIVHGALYPVLDISISKELSFQKTEVRRNFSTFLRNLWKMQKQVHRLPRSYIWGYFAAYIANLRNPSGAFIILVGPDGSGKTSVAEALAKKIKKHFFSVSLQHFNIQTFPRLASLIFWHKKVCGPDYTKPNSGTNAPIQSNLKAWIYLFYYGIELLIYSHLRLKRRLRLGQLVIFDRYFHDWFFQRSYRRVPHSMIRILLSSIKKPNLIVYLAGEPTEIFARKPELSMYEIDKQQTLICKNLLPFWQKRSVPILILDNVENSLNEVVKIISSELTRVQNEL